MSEVLGIDIQADCKSIDGKFTDTMQLIGPVETRLLVWFNLWKNIQLMFQIVNVVKGPLNFLTFKIWFLMVKRCLKDKRKNDV